MVQSQIQHLPCPDRYSQLAWCCFVGFLYNTAYEATTTRIDILRSKTFPNNLESATFQPAQTFDFDL